MVFSTASLLFVSYKYNWLFFVLIGIKHLNLISLYFHLMM